MIHERAGSDTAAGALTRNRMFAALTAAFLALVGVVIVLVAFGRQTRALQTELADAVEPASAALLDLQRILGLQMSAQRGYRLGGARESLEIYRLLLGEEDEVYRRLAPLAHGLGPEATATLTRLRGAAARWHEAVERSEDGEGADGLGGRLSTREGYFAVALSEADRLGALVQARAEQIRADIARRQRVEDGLIVMLLVLAAGALAVLARVGHRLHAVGLEARRIARVAESRHEALRRTAEEKEMFIRGITHDLKNPLGVIDGSAELLEIGARGELNAQQRATTQRIRRAAADMLGTINDLLELSRAEAAALRLDQREIEVNVLVRETFEVYRPALEKEGLVLRFTPLPEESRLTTDPGKVREILGNLLTNAGRHASPGGAVTVGLAHAGRGADGRAYVSVTVSDDGPGVPPGMEERIFQEFARGPDSEGSGLGLAIARKLARTLGGDLVLEGPRPSGGAAFTLLLPVETVSEPHTTATRTLDRGG